MDDLQGLIKGRQSDVLLFLKKNYNYQKTTVAVDDLAVLYRVHGDSFLKALYTRVSANKARAKSKPQLRKRRLQAQVSESGLFGLENLFKKNKSEESSSQLNDDLADETTNSLNSPVKEGASGKGWEKFKNAFTNIADAINYGAQTYKEVKNSVTAPPPDVQEYNKTNTLYMAGGLILVLIVIVFLLKK
jgi:hypothetical protein